MELEGGKLADANQTNTFLFEKSNITLFQILLIIFLIYIEKYKFRKFSSHEIIIIIIIFRSVTSLFDFLQGYFYTIIVYRCWEKLFIVYIKT